MKRLDGIYKKHECRYWLAEKDDVDMYSLCIICHRPPILMQYLSARSGESKLATYYE